MKLSQLIDNLNDVLKLEGDGYIWSIENDYFPCPRNMEIELTKALKKTDMGFNGGKKTKYLKINFEYDGVNCVDRSF